MFTRRFTGRELTGPGGDFFCVSRTTSAPSRREPPCEAYTGGLCIAEYGPHCYKVPFDLWMDGGDSGLTLKGDFGFRMGGLRASNKTCTQPLLAIAQDD